MKVSLRTALAVVLGWSCVTSQVQAQGMGQPYATGYGSPYSAPAQTAPAPQQGYYGNPAPYGAPANAYQNPASQFQAPAPQYQAQAPNFGQRYPLQQPGLQAPAYPASFGYRQDEVPLPSPDPNVAPVAPMPGQLPPQQVSPSDALGRPIELVPLDQQPMGSGYPQMPMQTMAPAHQHAPQGQAYYAPSQGGGTMESYPSTGCSNCYEQAMTGAWQGTVWDDSVCGTSNAVAPASRGVWFGGAYGLLMRRTYESPVYLSFDPGMPSVSNLNSNDANLGSMGGLEVAFGRQMCNGWAWQVSYWGLLREESRARVSGMPDTMLYGLSMVDYMPTGYATNTGQAYYDLAESHEVFRTN